MFQFSGFATISCSLQLHRLPHSDTGGSRVVCTSPPFFAAYHVLRRLREPRHPPCALISLPSLHLIVTYRHTVVFLSLSPLFRSLLSWLDYPPQLFFASLFLPVLSMNFLSPSIPFHATPHSVENALIAEEHNGNINRTRTNAASFETAPPNGLMFCLYPVSCVRFLQHPPSRTTSAKSCGGSGIRTQDP